MAAELDTVKKTKDTSYGEVRIADDVVANIAGIAATEVEGVAGTVGNMTDEFMNMMGVKTEHRGGVKVLLDGNMVKVKLGLIMKYGYNIPVTSKQVQERVKNAIENMTGLEVASVGIRIVGIDMSEAE